MSKSSDQLSTLTLNDLQHYFSVQLLNKGQLLTESVQK